MKGGGGGGTGGRYSIFISHMVQMKDHLAFILFIWTMLYIPHGSDESLPDTVKQA